MMINPILFLRKTRSLLRTEVQWSRKYMVYKKQLALFRKIAPAGTEITEYACMDDNTAVTPIEPHYTYHPAWAARALAQIKPLKHIDISSTTRFSTVVSAFIPVEFYDYRPANIHLSSFYSGKADLTQLHFADNSVDSLSCMHTVEHIGLGRYGDPIDIAGDVKAMRELQRVLKPGGNLLFVVPVGRPRIEFNAHRIYAYETIINNFEALALKEFALIPDNFDDVGYIIDPSPEFTMQQEWGCGCFWFIKK